SVRDIIAPIVGGMGQRTPSRGRHTSGLHYGSPGHPARGRYLAEAGLLARGSGLQSVFPGSHPSDMQDIGSPLTVAGAASEFRKRCTDFPLSPRIAQQPWGT